MFLKPDSISTMQKRSLDGATVERNYYPQGFTEHSGQTTTKYFYTKDHLGSIREVLGDDGATVHARLDYDPWGNVVSETNGAGGYVYTPRDPDVPAYEAFWGYNCDLRKY